MKILIAYATTEGQTRKITRHVARWLTDRGHSVELWPVSEGMDVDLGGFDRAVLAGSVHLRRLQPALEDFARAKGTSLEAVETLLLVVSLSAAGDDPEDRACLDEVVQDFTARTGWAPRRVEHVAGAFRFTRYDFFRAWAMRWIAAQKGQQVDPQQDREYTDWTRLSETLADWVRG